MGLGRVRTYDPRVGGVKRTSRFLLRSLVAPTKSIPRTRHSLGGRSHEPRVRDQRPWWSGDVGSDAADAAGQAARAGGAAALVSAVSGDRKSTRLNSSHVRISYAVF